ncbi:MAG: type III pantothenate kinase [Planctomycetota bacterium]|jgi:pantothenate kinase type III
MAAAQDRLLADLGNSRLKCASTDLREVHAFRWREPEQRSRLQDHLKKSEVQRIDLASSSDEGIALLQEEVFLGIDIVAITADQVPLQVTTVGTGIDRLLGAWMASEIAGGPVVLADCGTAFTLDVVDADRRFLGGAIGAGLGLQRRALAEACPHLDPPSRDAQDHGIPKDTASAVHAGTLSAFAAALRGLKREFLGGDRGDTACFLSGGDAAELQELLPEWRMEQDLVLRALQRLSGPEGE